MGLVLEIYDHELSDDSDASRGSHDTFCRDYIIPAKVYEVERKFLLNEMKKRTESKEPHKNLENVKSPSLPRRQAASVNKMKERLRLSKCITGYLYIEKDQETKV